VEWKFYPPNTAPKALDIVWCFFPLVESPTAPGPKSRPGLVRRCTQTDKGVYVEVAYGTSRFTNYSDCDLIVANSADIVEMGLPQATVFQLARTVTVPWAEEWFGTIGGHGPSLSHLTPKYCEFLAHMQKRGYFKT
jgi:hypothetical protein